MTLNTISRSLGLYYTEPPQLSADSGEQTWITRAANLVVVVSRVSAGTRLERIDNPDEYMLLLPPGMRARVSTPDAALEAGPDSLTIVPPGASAVEVLDAGTVTRVFSVRARDMADLAANREVYAQGAPSVAPLEDWPMPPEGYRLRHYRLNEYIDPKVFGRIFRSRNLMINVLAPVREKRDPRKFSPHSHADFEQISLALEGRFVHHLRSAWGPDSTQWQDDEHLEVHSPSTLVIPAGLIHTTAWTGEGVNWLVDVFSPPRMDFSLQPGVVRNADEYPMPGTA
jgi:mannose-6-phosphate isomerase-like protein (cupin superfamily)